MNIDYNQLTIEIIGIVVLSIFGFYAIRLLSTFRNGMLEKGWKYVTEGAIILGLGQIPYLLSWIGSASLFSLLNDVGMLMRFVGMIFLILGFRAQYQVWRLDNKDLSPPIKSGNRNLEK